MRPEMVDLSSYKFDRNDLTLRLSFKTLLGLSDTSPPLEAYLSADDIDRDKRPHKAYACTRSHGPGVLLGSRLEENRLLSQVQGPHLQVPNSPLPPIACFHLPLFRHVGNFIWSVYTKTEFFRDFLFTHELVEWAGCGYAGTIVIQDKNIKPVSEMVAAANAFYKPRQDDPRGDERGGNPSTQGYGRGMQVGGLTSRTLSVEDLSVSFIPIVADNFVKCAADWDTSMNALVEEGSVHRFFADLDSLDVLWVMDKDVFPAPTPVPPETPPSRRFVPALPKEAPPVRKRRRAALTKEQLEKMAAGQRKLTSPNGWPTFLRAGGRNAPRDLELVLKDLSRSRVLKGVVGVSRGDVARVCPDTCARTGVLGYAPQSRESLTDFIRRSCSTTAGKTAAKTGYSIHVDFPDPSKPHFMVLVKHDLRGIMTTLSGNAVTLEDGKRHGR
ncbi:hypothetical protein NBRC10512v2_002490 [Rhodotorula toruloides]